MTGVKETVYRPSKAAAKTYADLFNLYRTLHDGFGTAAFQGRFHSVMKDLIAIRDRVRKG